MESIPPACECVCVLGEGVRVGGGGGGGGAQIADVAILQVKYSGRLIACKHTRTSRDMCAHAFHYTCSLADVTQASFLSLS